MYGYVQNTSKNPAITMAENLHVMNTKLSWYFVVIED